MKFTLYLLPIILVVSDYHNKLSNIRVCAQACAHAQRRVRVLDENTHQSLMHFQQLRFSLVTTLEDLAEPVRECRVFWSNACESVNSTHRRMCHKSSFSPSIWKFEMAAATITWAALVAALDCHTDRESMSCNEVCTMKQESLRGNT